MSILVIDCESVINDIFVQSGGASSQDPVPENVANCRPLFLDASVRTSSDLETAVDKAKYLADMRVRVKFLMELEWEHSAPAKDEIPSARDQLVAMWEP